MSKFPWGKVLERFEYDFDGQQVEVVKYLATKFVNGSAVRGEWEDVPSYHIEELSESARSLDYILIAWIARKRIGLNQHALISGICRALCVERNPS
ncbi:hypothetical protein [Acidovorax radicis]|uniref:hypothetical protein n=1 Tax=Acidovorax radicis TaxID=758826 RepID=UPI001CFB01FD|nr:hypothetical protein [Acidovorax radicis]UCV00264.1 hypothetical protein KI609_05620 [Acidovorax radicis]